MNGDGQLRAFIERILRLKEEQDSLAADIREIYAEAKGSGFDKTAMGQLVSHLRKVERVGVAAVEEGQSTFDLYLSAYERATGTPIATHTHARGADAPSAFISAFTVAPAGELTDTQEQPETVYEIHERPSINAEAYPEAGPQAEASPAGIGTGTLAGHEGRSEGEAASADLPTHSHPQPAASLGADTAGAASSSTAPATLSEKKDCLKFKDGHCKISFDTPALCSVCNAERMKVKAA